MARSRKKFLIDKSLLVPLGILALLLGGIAYAIVSSLGYQLSFRDYLYTLSDATVYCYEHHSLRADYEEQSIRVDGDNAYSVYFLFTKNTPKRRYSTPEGAPDLVLDYGNGAVLECWRIRMEESARRSYGVFWRFTSPEGKVWMYDTDGVNLPNVLKLVSLKENEPW